MFSTVTVSSSFYENSYHENIVMFLITRYVLEAEVCITVFNMVTIIGMRN